jgi:uncharacterized coiled-coil protein SlyX
MASPAQINANRANALLSTGPATPETKSAVRHNAIKYGIHAESLIIPGEDPEEFEAFKEFQVDAWHPQDTAEQQCVDQLTTTLWRLNRLENAEAQIWASSMQTGSTLGDTLETKSPLLDRVGRMIDRLQRSIRQITKELQRLQAARLKAQRAACIPPRSYPTEQSQFLSEIQRRDPDFDDLEE